MRVQDRKLRAVEELKAGEKAPLREGNGENAMR